VIPSHLLLAQRIRDEIVELEAFASFLEGVSRADDTT
jgi:hypothetical protein